jgi:hypothetical protein
MCACPCGEGSARRRVVSIRFVSALNGAHYMSLHGLVLTLTWRKQGGRGQALRGRGQRTPDVDVKDSKQRRGGARGGEC